MARRRQYYPWTGGVMLLVGMLAGWLTSQWLLPHLGGGDLFLARTDAQAHFRTRLENSLRSLAAFRTSLAVRQELDPAGDPSQHWQAAFKGHWLRDDVVRAEEIGLAELDEPMTHSVIRGYHSRSGAVAPKQLEIDSTLRQALQNARISQGPRFVGPVTLYAGTPRERPNLLRVVLTVADRPNPATGNRSPRLFLFATLDLSNTGPRARNQETGWKPPPVTLSAHLGSTIHETNRVALLKPQRAKIVAWSYDAEPEATPFYTHRIPSLHGAEFTLAYYRDTRHPARDLALAALVALACFCLVGIGRNWRSQLLPPSPAARPPRRLRPLWLGLGTFAIGLVFTILIALKTRSNAIQADEQRFVLRANELRQLVAARVAKLEESILGLAQAMRHVQFASIENHRENFLNYVSWMNLAIERKGLLEVGLAESLPGPDPAAPPQAILRLWRPADDKLCLPSNRHFAAEDSHALTAAALDAWVESSPPSDLVDCNGAKIARGLRIFHGLNPQRARNEDLRPKSPSAPNPNPGYAYAFIDLQQAMLPAKGADPIEDIVLTIHPAHSDHPSQLLARIGPPEVAPSLRGRLITSQSLSLHLEFFRRDWKLRFQPTDDFYTLSGQGFEWVVLLVGTLLSSLASLALVSHSRGRQRAEDLAQSLGRFRASLRDQLEGRRRIEMNIHDHPLQELHIAQMSLKRALDALRKLPAAQQSPPLAPIQNQIEQGLQSLRGAGAVLRQIVWDDSTESLPPDTQLQEFRANLSRHFPGRIGLQLDPNLRTLTSQQADHLVSIVKEASYNALKHANPTRLDIRVAIQDGHCHAQVQNDGIGFLPESARPGRGLGHIRARAQQLGGVIQWHSTPSGPTSLELRFPTNPPQKP